MPLIKVGVWNMEWMNDLFGSDGGFKPDDSTVRGPKPPWEKSGPTVIKRRKALSGVIDELGFEVLVVVEGPNKKEELQLFFDSDVKGTWSCDVQPSHGGSQIIGLAVRRDTGRFADPPFERFNIAEGQGGEAERLSRATNPFTLDTDDDEIKELHKFERRPLYAEIRLAGGKRFRVVGLHLKSKGIFKSYEWSKWWLMADANRKKILAQCTQLRREFLDYYLTGEHTRDIPLIVCGDINDGPGMDTSERKLNASGFETLMGNVWKPELCLGNALFDGLDEKARRSTDYSSILSTRFDDPVFDSQHEVWIDHLLYSRNRPGAWLKNARTWIKKRGSKDKDFVDILYKYKYASDHSPLSAEVDTDML